MAYEEHAQPASLDRPPGLSPAAAALAARCEAQVNELARRMARGVFEQLRGYAELPGDVKDVEIAATARHAMRLFLRGAAEGSGWDSLEYFQERAAQRAEEGMPLHLLLRTYTLGARELWRALREVAGPGEQQALAELTEALFTAADHVVGAVAESYLDERVALAAERHEQRRSRARALLDGRPVVDGAAPDGPVLVLFLRFGTSAATGAPSPVSVRRLLRRVQAVLDRAFDTEVLAVLDGDGGHVVVPGVVEPPGGLRQLLGEAVGPELRLAAAAATTAGDIPRTAHLTSEVVRVAAACGVRPGAHRLDDVLLEYHLSRPSEGSARIVAMLDPLADRPELVATLRTHLAQRQDRRATAQLLNLHPNSVDNRLARIQDLTGLDLADPRDVALALAALLLRDADTGVTE